MCIASTGVCNCSLCRSDIKALALNYLPARYISTLAGRLMTKLNATYRQESVDILAAITGAINRINENPRH